MVQFFYIFLGRTSPRIGNSKSKYDVWCMMYDWVRAMAASIIDVYNYNEKKQAIAILKNTTTYMYLA